MVPKYACCCCCHGGHIVLACPTHLAAAAAALPMLVLLLLLRLSLQDTLLPCPANIKMLYVPADLVANCFGLQQWAQQELDLVVRLLQGCFVLARPQDIPDGQLPPPEGSCDASIPWQLRAIPGLSAAGTTSNANAGNSSADNNNGSAASIPWRLRRIESVEQQAPSGGDANDDAAAALVVVLSGGGRVRVSALCNEAFMEVAEHEVWEVSTGSRRGKSEGGEEEGGDY